MTDYKSLVRYRRYDNRITFPPKISSYIVPDFAAAITIWLKRKAGEALILDFSSVKNPYSNGMLAIIAIVHNLKLKGHTIKIIDLQYEMEDKDCLLIKMKTETTGFGTRRAGQQMRTKILNLINSRPEYPVYIDWEGIPVISSSFADEFVGKLFLEIGPINFSAIIRNKSIEPLVKQLLDKAILQRLAQGKAQLN